VENDGDVPDSELKMDELAAAEEDRAEANEDADEEVERGADG
jgi:hypothetical protein